MKHNDFVAFRSLHIHFSLNEFLIRFASEFKTVWVWVLLPLYPGWPHPQPSQPPTAPVTCCAVVGFDFGHATYCRSTQQARSSPGVNNNLLDVCMCVCVCTRVRIAYLDRLPMLGGLFWGDDLR